MKGTLTQNGTVTAATPQDVKEAAASGGFFWLDIERPGAAADDELTALLASTFHLHPVAIEAAERFGQRARIDNYDDDVAHIVTFGMADDRKTLAEVHCFVSASYIISIHEGNCPALAQVRDRIGAHHASATAPPQVAILYLIMDTLVDSFFPVLSDFDDAIDDLETAILRSPTEEQLGTLFDMKREILAIRKAITPQRDMISGLNAGVSDIPGLTSQASAYFRNLYDHLIRISDMVDGYRDLISGAMDTHLSMVSNRLNVVMKQLAIIATVFLPLGFLTGFFGQNFAWLTGHLQSGLPEFLIFGVGAELVAIVLLLIFFKRRGWLGSGPTA